MYMVFIRRLLQPSSDWCPLPGNLKRRITERTAKILKVPTQAGSKLVESLKARASGRATGSPEGDEGDEGSLKRRPTFESKNPKDKWIAGVPD